MVHIVPSGAIHGERDNRRALEARLNFYLTRKEQVLNRNFGMARKGFRAEDIESALRDIDKMVKHYSNLLEKL